MFYAKIGLCLAVVLTSALLVFVFWEPQNSLIPSVVTADGVAITNSEATVQNAFVEGLPPQKNKAPSEINVSDATTTAHDPGNLTQRLAKMLAGGILSDNPSGPYAYQNQQAINVPSQIDPSKFTLTNQDVLDWRALVPEVTDGMIKIVPDSEENYIAYIKTSQAEYNKTIDAVADYKDGLKDVYDIQRAAMELQLPYATAVANFYAMPVPQSLKETHKKEIALLIVQKNMFVKLEKSSYDPLSAILAARASLAVNAEFIAVRQQLADFSEKNNLKLN